ncbi:MAG: hypothetical protein IKN56_06235, partial [Clostridia bacterium]|nr:hypothetical protein [Clostridia bacterium]
MTRRRWMLAIILTVALLSSLFTTFALADNEAAVPETAVTGEEPVAAAEEGAATLIAPAPAGEEETVPETAEEKAETLAATDAEEVTATGAAAGDVFTLGEGEDAVEYDLSDGEQAAAYVDGYADNIAADPSFDSHIKTAIAKVRESIKSYATFLALLPPLIAIILALITKEVYSSLIVGIIVGGVIYAGGNFETIMNHVVQDGFIAS